MWFTNFGNNTIGRITTGGAVTNYTGTGISDVYGIAAGPDGALWFTNDTNDSIGRITTGGAVTNYTGTGINDPYAITSGPDGALWFTNLGSNTIGRITTAGAVTNYTGTGISDPGRDRRRSGRRRVVHQLREQHHRAHHDGRGSHQLHRNGNQRSGGDHHPARRRLVVHQLGNNTIGRITTGGAVTNYTGTGISGPSGIAAGPDGALWFTNGANNSIGRITTAGAVTNYNTEAPRNGHQRAGRDHRRPGRRLVVHQLCGQLHRAHHHRLRASPNDERALAFQRGDLVGIDPPWCLGHQRHQRRVPALRRQLRPERPGDLHGHADLLRMVVQLEHHDGSQRFVFLGVRGLRPWWKRVQFGHKCHRH